MKKQLILVGVAVLLIVVGLSGCFVEETDTQKEKDLDNIPQDTINATINNFEFKDKNGIAVIEVDISGNSDFDLVLIKDNNEVCSKSVKKRQVDDGNELVELELCNVQYMTPEKGNYKIAIYHGDEVITEEEIYRNGPKLEITDCDATFWERLEKEQDAYYNRRYLDEVSILYKNTGDLPAYVIMVFFNGSMHNVEPEDYWNVQVHFYVMPEYLRHIGVGESNSITISYLELDQYLAFLNPFEVTSNSAYFDIDLFDSQGNRLNGFYSYHYFEGGIG